MRIKGVLVTVFAATALAGPAIAEPSFDGLGAALALFALVAIGYLAFGIALIVLAVLRHWRAFWWVLGGGLAVILVLPLLDGALLKYQQAKVRAAEILQEAPDLRDKTLLFVTGRDVCNLRLCPALIKLRGEAPLWTLSTDVLIDLPSEAPIDLATVPLQQFVKDPNGHDSYMLQDPVDERPVFDYIVIGEEPYFLSFSGGVEDRLEQMPGGTLLGKRLIVHSLAAPIVDNRLDFRTLKPDYLKFYINRNALAAPLFPENITYAERRSYEWHEEQKNWFCGNGSAEQSQAQSACSRELRR